MPDPFCKNLRRFICLRFGFILAFFTTVGHLWPNSLRVDTPAGNPGTPLSPMLMVTPAVSSGREGQLFPFWAVEMSLPFL